MCKIADELACHNRQSVDLSGDFTPILPTRDSALEPAPKPPYFIPAFAPTGGCGPTPHTPSPLLLLSSNWNGAPASE